MAGIARHDAPARVRYCHCAANARRAEALYTGRRMPYIHTVGASSMNPRDPQPPPVKGRGATFNPANRFRVDSREPCDDGWQAAVPSDDTDAPPPPRTIVTIQPARSIIAHNDSPDVPFSQSINPYQGCEPACFYGSARPSQASLVFSRGMVLGPRFSARRDGAKLLRGELANPRYRCDPIALGTNPAPYQPIEREWRI